MLTIGTPIQPKLKVLLTLPKFLRTQSVHFPPLYRHLLLILVIVIGIIGFELRGVAVFIQQELREIVVLE